MTNPLAGSNALVEPDDVAVLSAVTFWRSPSDLATLFPHRSVDDLAALLERWHELRFLECPTDAADAREASLDEWSAWGSVATEFHLATRDVTYASRERAGEVLARRQAQIPPPPPLKHVEGDGPALPPFQRDGAWPEVLLRRRSWRRFGSGALSLSSFSDLAGLTFAVQQWSCFDGQRVAFKTSPSGGACHSIEVYWAIRDVESLQPGLYHYAADRHALTRVAPGWTTERLKTYFPQQPWFEGACAVALMTSVFERTQWKYRDPRAYRVIMLEAGHLCQTFCLTATWLGLAPFCSAALADSEIERDLGVDGIAEAAVYAAGVGIRPAGVDWAPYPDYTGAPEVVLPGYRAFAEGEGSE